MTEENTTTESDNTTSNETSSTESNNTTTSNDNISGNTGSDNKESSTQINFRDLLSDDYKEKYKEFKNADDVMKGYDNLAKMLGKSDRIVVPDENATDEQKTEYQKKLNQLNGVPESADKYQVTLPENLPDGFIKEDNLNAMKQVFLDNGIGDKQAQAIVQAHLEMQKKEYDDIIAPMHQEIDALKSKWGDKFETNVQLTDEFMKKYVDPETKEKVTERFGHDPVMREFLFGLMQKTGEKNVNLNNDSNSGITNVNDLKNKMRTMQNEKAYMDPNDPNHSGLRKEVRRIATQIAEMQNKG